MYPSLSNQDVEMIRIILRDLNFVPRNNNAENIA